MIGSSRLSNKTVIGVLVLVVLVLGVMGWRYMSGMGQSKLSDAKLQDALAHPEKYMDASKLPLQRPMGAPNGAK